MKFHKSRTEERIAKAKKGFEPEYHIKDQLCNVLSVGDVVYDAEYKSHIIAHINKEYPILIDGNGAYLDPRLVLFMGDAKHEN